VVRGDSENWLMVRGLLMFSGGDDRRSQDFEREPKVKAFFHYSTFFSPRGFNFHHFVNNCHCWPIRGHVSSILLFKPFPSHDDPFYNLRTVATDASASDYKTSISDTHITNFSHFWTCWQERIADRSTECPMSSEAH
jgi:hypothetical protein